MYHVSAQGVDERMINVHSSSSSSFSCVVALQQLPVRPLSVSMGRHDNII